MPHCCVLLQPYLRHGTNIFWLSFWCELKSRLYKRHAFKHFLIIYKNPYVARRAALRFSVIAFLQTQLCPFNSFPNGLFSSRFQAFAVAIITFYSFGVISQRVAFVYRRFGIPCWVRLVLLEIRFNFLRRGGFCSKCEFLLLYRGKTHFYRNKYFSGKPKFSKLWELAQIC